MNKNIKINVVRVFINEKREYGNPVGIILDEKQKIEAKERQIIAKKLGFSETVFINNIKAGKISIFNPQQECSFAMHATLGTACFINRILNSPINHVESMNERIDVWNEKDKTWIRAKLSVLPSWNFEEYSSVSEVKDISRNDALLKKHTLVWTWLNKDKNIIRARTFAADWGIPEDEANGSGSMLLSTKLNRPLTIIHGKGSVIYAKPFKTGFADVGGRVTEDSP